MSSCGRGSCCRNGSPTFNALVSSTSWYTVYLSTGPMPIQLSCIFLWILRIWIIVGYCLEATQLRKSEPDLQSRMNATRNCLSPAGSDPQLHTNASQIRSGARTPRSAIAAILLTIFCLSNEHAWILRITITLAYCLEAMQTKKNGADRQLRKNASQCYLSPAGSDP